MGRLRGNLDVEIALLFPLKIENFTTNYSHTCSIDFLELFLSYLRFIVGDITKEADPLKNPL